jgi:SAM-dependent methyltransferase
MKECSKSIVRRMSDSNFIRKYFVGNGIDIGGKPDPLSLYKEFFPLATSIKTFDLEDGDAEFLNNLDSNLFDFVHSSHCLEHLNDPRAGFARWFEVVKPGGYLIITVPEEDLYEQGNFPSSFNKDHKWTFTIYKDRSWSKKSVNLVELAISLGEMAEIIKIEKLDSTYRYSFPHFDQTLTPIAESSIELVIRKRTIQETALYMNRIKTPQLFDNDLLVHLNQYKDDIRTLKNENKKQAPFQNITPIDE